MALNRRKLLLALSGAGLGLACSVVNQGQAPARYVEIASAGSAAPSAPTILVCMPATSQTAEVWTGLKDELGADYRLVAVEVDGASESARIAEAMQRHRPAGLVLMNNPTAAAYRSYQRTSGLSRFPPAVIVMTSFLDGQSQIRAATGISYEIPLITVVTNLRKLMASPIERIGVVVRAPLVSYVERQAALAQREQIAVLMEAVSAMPNASELKRALRRLKGAGADAIWILNDDRLLNPRLITEAWLPGLNERPWTPAIVGAASLVSPVHSFGTFAVLPDHTALGAQAAGLVLDIADNQWELSADAEVQLPLSTTTTMDLVQAKERFELRNDALSQVDRILE